jgi:hypothetical protein
VERFNRTLCESLAKLVKQTNEWDEYVKPVLFAYRTSKQSTTQVTPFYLTYGREAILPMDDHFQPEETLPSRIDKLLNVLPHDRENTRKRIDRQQNKQKSYHDQHIKGDTKFDIGDKVLLYRAEKEKQWSGKLDEKWKGPYYIHIVQPNGSYKLRTLTGLVLKTPFNRKLLKPYRDTMDSTNSLTMNDLLEQEFQQFIPFNSEVPLAPYTNEMDLSEKIKVTQKALRRSIELNSRLTSLINAYYLGKIFNESESISAKFKNKQKNFQALRNYG